MYLADAAGTTITAPRTTSVTTTLDIAGSLQGWVKIGIEADHRRLRPLCGVCNSFVKPHSL